MWREFKYLYEGVMEDPDSRADTITPRLCRQHAALKPVSLSLLLVQELDFWPQDYLNGHRPLDPDFVTVNTLTDTAC
jgi:hypothetical protein